MLQHIILLAYLASLVIGALVAFYSFQLHKTYTHSFLKDFGGFTIAFNLVVFFNLVVKYIYVNFSLPGAAGYNTPFYTIVFLAVLIPMLGYFYAFIRVTFWLKEGNIPNTFKTVFSVGLFIVGISCIIGITTYINNGSNQWILRTYVGVEMVGVFVLLGMSVLLLVRERTEQKDDRRTAVRAFGSLYLIGFLALFLSLQLPKVYMLYLIPVGFLYLNTVPVIWFKKYFLKSYVRISSEERTKLLDIVAKDHKISKREREIMELVLRGKSNKEIENLLFISYNTVKNHIYSIYQKLDVNSRGQMICVLMEAQKQLKNPLDEPDR